MGTMSVRLLSIQGPVIMVPVHSARSASVMTRIPSTMILTPAGASGLSVPPNTGPSSAAGSGNASPIPSMRETA